MASYREFHIHADNIVECERTFNLITSAVAEDLTSVVGPLGSPVCPEFQLNLESQSRPLHLTFFPGFGRWNEDILQLVRDRGGTLREAADAIISGVADDKEKPVIAIEYCGVK